MSLTAAVPDERRPHRLPGWRFWLTNAVVVPIAAGVAIYFSLAGTYSPTWIDTAATIVAVAAGCAALYALASWSHGIDVRKTVAGYVLAAALTVPWGYVWLIGLMVFACEFQGRCLS